MLDIKCWGRAAPSVMRWSGQPRLPGKHSLANGPNCKITLEHIQDILEIEHYPILFTPALVVNEKVVCTGRVPKKEEVIGWYRAALEQVT